MGISALRVKVATQDTDGGLFVIEQALHQPGGPARHMHPEQDEWFYALEGEFRVEVDGARFRLSAGDSLLAPRGLPHCWAFVGPGEGRLLIGFAPAGRMEAFFDRVSPNRSMPPRDPQLWSDHGMVLLGPPLELDATWPDATRPV